MARRWRQHFSALEAGCDVSEHDLARLAMEPHQVAWPSPPDLESIPTVSALAGVLREAKASKSPGADGVPNGVGRVCPDALAEQLHPLAMKLCYRGAEPRMYKGRGPWDMCTFFRGILLLPTAGKALHKAMRPTISHHFEQSALSFQLGERKGMATCYAAHAVRCFARTCIERGQSFACILADIQAAYYSAVRELTAGNSSELSFEHVCRGLRLASEDLETLRSHLAGGSALDLDQASPGLQRLMAEINSKTWMTMAADEGGPILTCRGTRPGCSWADVVFGLLVKRILRRRDMFLPSRSPPPSSGKARSLLTLSRPMPKPRLWRPLLEIWCGLMT